ncbi:type IV pilus twitching motility protein PilT [Geothermobacter hydrogeniphilus]|uniref:Type IV pili twitching motility protein PilT n=1 Tax=Geothermobacter hydrogeniphilus TaxID=1969733 RepID=A0A1X0Y7V7_9BACT|nr:type IV pilus twitching motility protein PilT [Geothermobacter hydrogeniphilus]ORJ61245.1 type IV pili twitching motility protein PilT [Geothermobacter hydrogeniphilus]
MAKIDGLFKILQEKGGSDLHLSPQNPPLMRSGGQLQPAHSKVLSHPQCQALLYEIMNEAQRDEFEQRRDLDFAYEVPALKARFRANIFWGRLGISAVFRIIPTEILSAEQLGLPQTVLRFTEHKKGLVLVTGPTGSGKSTTLAAMVDHVNRNRSEHILTVEDPIEFVHQSNRSLVNQREVGNHTASFAAALKAALREDPDIILVGEMRDLETIELAITAAETGHLVFGTLHTSSAAKTVDRIINVFPTSQQEQIRTMLAESLKGVIAQQLPRTVDGKRCAALEILSVTPAVANLIREGKTFQIPSVIQTGRGEGMQLMDQSLQELLRGKRISAEEAHRFAHNKAQFAPLLKGVNHE